MEDYEALYAEAWDVNVFCLKFLKKTIEKAKYDEVYTAFRVILETIKPISYEQLKYDSQDKSDVDYNRLVLGDGSYKKLNLSYNQSTYELDVEE